MYFFHEILRETNVDDNLVSYQVDVAEALQCFDEMSEKLFDVRICRRLRDAAVDHQPARLKSRIVPEENTQSQNWN